MDISTATANMSTSFAAFLQDVDTMYSDGAVSQGKESLSPDVVRSMYHAAGDYSGTLTPEDFNRCRQVWDATTMFLNDNNLFAGKSIDYQSMDVVDIDNITKGETVANLGTSAFDTLCDNAGVSTDPAVRKEVVAEIGLVLQRMLSFNTSDSYRIAHYVNGRESYQGTLDGYNAMFPAPVISMLSNDTLIPSAEAFGANIDKVITDTRMTIAITLLRFHKSLLNRMVHRRQRTTTIVEYEIPYAESYDLFKSMSDDGNVREGREHRSIFLDLYRDPNPVTQALTPLYPKKEREKEGEHCVVEDGILAFNEKAYLFDLSMDKNQIGRDHIDYTTLVSEGVCLDKVYFSLTDGQTTEEFVIDTNKERLVPTAQNRDSSYRMAQFNNRIKLTKASKTSAGAASTLLAQCTDTDYIVLDVSVFGGIYLKNSETKFMGSGGVYAHAANGQKPSEAITTLAGKLKVEMIGYSLYAFYSEENLRTSNTAFRTNKFMRAYEIMCGKNYLVDYSLNQVLPEYVMAIVTEGMSLGMDDRAMKLFEENARLVYNRVQNERVDDSYLSNLERINFDYVAGTRVNPYIYIDSIDMDNVDTIRSSDFMSDARQLFDTRLTRIMSLIHANSLYRQQLEPGEVPNYNLVHSNIILENLVEVTQIHAHI